MKKTSLFNKLVSFGICYTLLVCAAPVKAGILVGEFSSKVNEYKKFADSFNTKSIGYLLFFDKTTKKYSTCSGTLIRSGKDTDPKTKKEYVGGWVLTSAHCADTASKTLGAKFVTEQGEADVDAFLPHYKYKKGLYAESKANGVFTCDALIEKRTCKNTPEQAIYDIALVHLNKDLTLTTTLEAIPPSKQEKLPEKGFIGGFVGYGRQGSGIPSNPIKAGLFTLFKNGSDPKNEATRLIAATDDRLGGKNFLKVLNYSATSKTPAGQVLSADLDNGTKLMNVDLQPDTNLKLEYSPYVGDSGAGVFDDKNNLVAIVSGAGYGNTVNGLKLFQSFTPPNYGSLSFYTPLAQHRGWIANAIKANKFKTFTKKRYVPTDEKYSPAILPTGNLASTGKLLPDSMMKIFADVIVQPYSEAFNEAVWKEIFPSKPVS
jgi:hypothetical protein